MTSHAQSAARRLQTEKSRRRMYRSTLQQWSRQAVAIETNMSHEQNQNYATAAMGCAALGEATFLLGAGDPGTGILCDSNVRSSSINR
jgi:hypothetical protein